MVLYVTWAAPLLSGSKDPSSTPSSTGSLFAFRLLTLPPPPPTHTHTLPLYQCTYVMHPYTPVIFGVGGGGGGSHIPVRNIKGFGALQGEGQVVLRRRTALLGGKRQHNYSPPLVTCIGRDVEFSNRQGVAVIGGKGGGWGLE